MGTWGIATIIFIAPLLYVVGLLHWVELPKAVFIQVGVALTLFLWLMLREDRHSDKIRFPSITLPISLFLAWSALSLLWATNPYDGFVILLHWFCCALLIFLIVNLVADPKPLLIAGATSGFIVAAYGLLQVCGLAAYVPVIGDIKPITNLLGSFLGHPNTAGRFMVVTLPFAVILVWIIKNWSRWVFLFMAGTILSFLCLSGCRAAIVALACMGFAGLVWRFNGKIILFAGAAALFSVIIIFSTGGIDIEKLKTNPRVEFILPVLKSGGSIIGVGLGNTRIMYGSLPDRPERTKSLKLYYHLKDLHNDYVQIWYELGHVGFALLLSCAFYIGRLFYKGRKDPIKLAMAISIVGLAVTGLFSFPAYMPVGPMMVGACLGIAEI